VLALVTFILVAPFYYVFLASLKNATEIFSYPPKLLADPALFRQLPEAPVGYRLPALDVNTRSSRAR